MSQSKTYNDSKVEVNRFVHKGSVTVFAISYGTAVLYEKIFRIRYLKTDLQQFCIF